MNEKPKSLRDYKKWVETQFGVRLDGRFENHFESVINKLHDDMLATPFWREVSRLLVSYEQEYTLKTKYPLLLSQAVPPLLKKPLESFLLKTYRKNVLDNRHWPEKPHGGWLQPDVWLSKVGDLIRTSIVVKYLDGVDFLLEKLGRIAESQNLKTSVTFEARDEGYYAVHFYTFHDLSIPTMSWDTKTISVALEVQITTQLQDVIRRLLHSYYEERRVSTRRDDRCWQWRFRSEEFGANYLGHILHYIEGVIVDIREKKTNE